MIVSLKTLRLAATGDALALMVAAPASAHHSASMFDRSKPVTIKGTIKAFNWVNPHCSIIVIDEKTGETWNIESTSPGVLTRNGWTKRSLKPGDHVEMSVGPLRTGGPAGVIIDVKNLDTGETLKRAV
jgi:hypothetical protein